MVKYSALLDETFHALSHPARRAILARLERDAPLSVSDLAHPLDIKLPAMMKHLDVLSAARLIRRAKYGRTVQVQLAARPLRDARAWLERFWSVRMDRLAVYAERKEAEARARGK
jgi:DNA-binding transcriptional ArsR family regulator